MLVDKSGKIFGKFNVIDFIVGVVIVGGTLGVMLVQSGIQVTSGEEVKGEADIHTYVYIPGLKTLDKDMLKPGEKTSITIRNQPRGEVTIEKVMVSRTQITLPGGSKGMAVTDPSAPDTYNYTVVLKDHAMVTKEGYVSEGVKVKVGLPIELEGFKYRLNGRIADVTADKEVYKK